MKSKRILSLLLALTMLFSCIGITAMAEESATVVTTEADLAAALAAGGTVTLGADILVNTMIAIPSGVTVTLDLNGKAITSGYQTGSTTKHIYPISNYGVLTIADSSTEKTGSVEGRGIMNQANAKLVIESGNYYAIDSDGGAAVWNYGDATFNGGTFEAIAAAVVNYTAASATINSGTYTSKTNAAVNNNANCDVTINGGTFRSDGTYTIQNRGGTMVINNATVDAGFGAVGAYGGTTTINDGTFLPTGVAGNTYHVVYVNDSSTTVTINGGTYKMNYPADAVPDSGSAVANLYNGNLTITGGSFTSHFDGFSPVELSTGSVITGGKFMNHSGEASNHSYVTKFLAEGLELDETGAVVAQEGVVAIIGSTTYKSFGEALAAAEDGDTIQLMPGEFEMGSVQFPVTLKNITIKGAANKATIIKNSLMGSYSGSTVNYDGITFDGIVFDNSQIVFTGERSGEVIYKNWTITNCEFKNITSTANAAVHFNLGADETFENLTFTNNVINGVSGGNVSGLRANYLSGNVTITGNNISNVAWNAVQIVNSNTNTFTVEDNIFAASANEGILNLHNVTATEELKIAENQFLVADGQPGICYLPSGDVSGNYWGGSAPSKLPDGVTYSSYYTTNENGVLGNLVKKELPVAQIGETPYPTLQAAIDAAAEGDTVTLLDDIKIESDLANPAKGYFNIAADDKITLDLNSKTIDVTDNSTGNFIVLYNYGDLTIKNGTINLTSTNNREWNAQSTIILNRGGNLTVESGTYTHNGGTDMAITLDDSGNSFGDAYMTINDGTITSTYVAIRMRMADTTLNGNPGNGMVYLTVNDGTISGTKRGIWGQITNASTDSLGELAVTGGTISGDTDAAINIDSDDSENIAVTISGTAVIKGKISGDADDYTVTGGLFSVKPEELEEGYVAISDLDGNYVVGKKPTATVDNLGATVIKAGEYTTFDIANNKFGDNSTDMPLGFVMQFVADETAEEGKTSPYAEWYADFVLSFEGLENGSFVANGCYLAGYYDGFGWYKIPVDGMTIKEGEKFPVMLSVNIPQDYQYICSSVGEFLCAMYLTPEILEQNPNLKVNLELVMVENDDRAYDELKTGEKIYSVTKEDYTAEEFVVKYVAEIGDKKYVSLEDAIAAANADDTIKLIDNIELPKTVTVPADKTITLDLAGKTVSMVYAENATANHEMIHNLGNLTIMDTVDNGKLSYKYTGKSLGTTYAANTITTEPGSVLTVKSGIIENLTYDQAVIAYAIDGRTNTGTADVTVNINGGTVTSLRQSIRIFANSLVATGTLNITDGDITGRVIVQNANDKNNGAALNISGGTFTANGYKTEVLYIGGSNGSYMTMEDVSISNGTFKGKVDSNVTNTGFITGGTFTESAKNGTNEALLAENFEFVENSDGTYGVQAKNLIELEGTSLLLENTLAINFFYNASAFEGTDYYAMISHDTPDGKEISKIEYANWIKSGNLMKITYNGIAAKQMSDVVEITIYDSEGKQVSKTDSESLRGYAVAYFNKYKNDTSRILWKTAMADMLNYGAAAQKFFGYREDDLANSIEGSFVTDYATKEINPTGEYKSSESHAAGTTLVLSDRIELKAIFTDITDGMYAEITYTDHYDNVVEPYRAEIRKNEGGKYFEVVADKLVIADANQNVKFTVYNSDGTEFAWIEDSINEYLAFMMSRPNSDPLYEMTAKFTSSAYDALHPKSEQ